VLAFGRLDCGNPAQHAPGARGKSPVRVRAAGVERSDRSHVRCVTTLKSWQIAGLDADPSKASSDLASHSRLHPEPGQLPYVGRAGGA
jgi:hypothetical protein